MRNVPATALVLMGVGLASALVPTTWNGSQYDCKCYPGDGCWPGEAEWTTLNSTVGGNLQVNIPPGAVCYDTFQGPLGNQSTYDADACAVATKQFADESWQISQPAAALWTYFTNDTCRPATDPAAPCSLGFYGIYVITATEPAHVKASIDFAREHDLRLLIRNTGHDFLGRSTGWGSLIVNMQSFQDVAFTDKYTGPGGYEGSAVTIGAGVQARTLLRQAHAQSLPVGVVTGECPTVGVAGGLVQGGGHGPLTPLHGFVADNVLSFDLITAQGEFVTANSDTNADLFWALRGGGPATYAVVLSATFKTVAEKKSAGVILNINSTMTNSSELFWEGVRIFHSHTNRLVEDELYAYFELNPMRLHVQPIVGVGKSAAELDAMVQPLLDDLEAKGVPYDSRTKEFDTFFDLYLDLFEDEPAGGSALTGGWAFSHQDVADNNDGIIEAFKTSLSPRDDLAGAGFVVGHLWKAADLGTAAAAATAINPRFRNTSSKIITSLLVPADATWAQKQDLQHVLTDLQDEALRKAGPGGSAYVNEADPFQEDWQGRFWGTAYPQLLEVRKRWDPQGLFYAVSTPGTEDWEVIDFGTKLCKRSSRKRCP